MRPMVALLAFVCLSPPILADDWLQKAKIKGSFEDTRDGVVNAIESRGLVISHTSHIADMLTRTGADLGATKKIYDRAEIIEFCSASLSRKMMEADPHHIVFCPFSISVYTLPGQTDSTWVAYRKPTGSAASIAGFLLDEVLQEISR